ncbi:MAG: phage holin family protein [Rhodothermia bacterium]|nr:phage holin family protein [Rhodothermia bacterium]
MNVFNVERVLSSLLDAPTSKALLAATVVVASQVLNALAPIEGLVNADSRLVLGAILLFLLDLVTGVWAAIRDRRFAWGRGLKQTATKAATYAVFGFSMAILSNTFPAVPVVSVLTDHAFNFAVAWMMITDVFSIAENMLIAERVKKFLFAIIPALRTVSPEAAEVAGNLNNTNNPENVEKS